MSKVVFTYDNYFYYSNKLEGLRKEMNPSTYDKMVEIFGLFYHEISIIFRYQENRIMELHKELEQKNKSYQSLEEIKNEDNKYEEKKKEIENR